MQSYLIISQSSHQAKDKINELTQKMKLGNYPFELNKIDDVRQLSSFVKLNISEPTAIIIEDIDNATDEAMSAFLKNLEEPQKNVYYILTAKNQGNLLPTILSRCQVIRTVDKLDSVDTKLLQKFLKKSTNEKLEYVSDIKDRQEAINFVDSLVSQTHNAIHLKTKNYKKAAEFLQKAIATSKALKANGNVSLQLTNFVLNLE